MASRRFGLLGSLVFGGLLTLSCREQNPIWQSQATTEATAEATTEASADETPDSSGSDGSSEGPSSSDDTSVPMCEEHEELCGNECADLLTTRQHCGACNEQCWPPSKQCVDGECEK